MEALVAVVVIVVVALAGGIWIYSRQQRTKKLQGDFGPEYERALRQKDRDKGQAERELLERQKRVEQLNLRDLTAEERGRFGEEWRQTQARFVDDPRKCLEDGHFLGAG